MPARTALVAAAGLTAVAPLSHAQPINDSCNNALPISPCGGVYTGSTVGATQSGSSSCSPGATRDVWHSVTIDNPGFLDVFTCPASFDTVISLHTACPSPQSFERGCNDNSAYCGTAYPNASHFRVQVGPGIYFIRVAGVNGSTGTYTLNTNFTPINDACVDAYTIGEGVFSGATICATIDGSADCAALAPAPDTWYHYIPSCSGSLVAFICPASFDTVLSVHSGCPGTVSNQIACNDDSAYCGTAYPNTSAVFLPVTHGGVYFIRVSGFNGARGTFVLNTLLTTDTPPNDNCSAASPISVGETQFFTCGATTDGPAELLCNFQMDPQIHSDIWYRYTAPCAGRTTVSIPQSSFFSRLAVYNTCPTGPNQVVACNNQNLVFFPSSAGQQFLIRVGGYLTYQQGNGTLRIICDPDPCYPNCDGSTLAPVLNVNDFICFNNRFAAGDSYANCDGSTVAPVLNVNDFTCFLNKYAAGCP